MSERDRTLGGDADGNQWPGIDSRYRLIVVAALRAKQLQRGAAPRIEPDPRGHRHTYIALEEAKQGLVPFVNDSRTPHSDGDIQTALI